MPGLQGKVVWLGALAGILLTTGILIGCVRSGSPASPGVEDKIGQMLMVGFRGTLLQEDMFILRDIRRHNLGGVILFDYDVVQQQADRNIASPDQVRRLVAALQEAATVPLLIAVDQEGGKVARLKQIHGFPPTVSHGRLGQQDEPTETLRQSGQIAETLSSVGIGLNLAPVVDLCAHPENPVIAGLERCFSADPATVIRHALGFIDGHHQRGILTTLKHFPGHGSSRTDSHQGFTDVSDTWSPAELVPYARIIEAGQADAVMTAHVFNDQLDDQHPATLSSATINGLLRDTLGFDGVVLSDDLQMGAITAYYGFETAIRMALEAGVDILVFGNNLSYDEEIVPRVIGVIRTLVETGVISESRIEQSYQRIMRLKNLKERLPKSQRESNAWSDHAPASS